MRAQRLIGNGRTHFDWPKLDVKDALREKQSGTYLPVSVLSPLFSVRWLVEVIENKTEETHMLPLVRRIRSSNSLRFLPRYS